MFTNCCGKVQFVFQSFPVYAVAMNNLELALNQSDAHLTAYLTGTPLDQIRADGLALIAARAAALEASDKQSVSSALADQKARILAAVQAA